jgi:adenylate kinase
MPVRIQTNQAAGIGALGSGAVLRPALPSVGQAGALPFAMPAAISFAGALPSSLAPSLPALQAGSAVLSPEAAPNAGGADLQEAGRGVMAQGLAPEAMAEISARVFDGKAEAPVVQADLPISDPGSQAQAKTQAPVATLGPRALNRPVRLIITGPPGSGKGTYSQLLSREYGIPHISVGELLRSYAKARPDVAAIMAQGRLVPTDLVLRVVRERLARPDVVERGFILDGFPRRVVEARALESMLGKDGVDAVIALDVPEAELLRRILARGRADDNPSVFTERMRIYREDTLPAAAIFRKGRAVLAPDVAGSVVETNYRALRSRFDRWASEAGLKP